MGVFKSFSKCGTVQSKVQHINQHYNEHIHLFYQLFFLASCCITADMAPSSLCFCRCACVMPWYNNDWRKERKRKKIIYTYNIFLLTETFPMKILGFSEFSRKKQLCYIYYALLIIKVEEFIT
jgi:hypothetical protein